MDLGSLIRRRRMERGLTMRDLAAALGVTHGAVAQWENGSSRPSIDRLIDLSAALAMEFRSFLGEGSPYAGQIVEDADELTLLTAWRRVAESDRPTILRMICSAVDPIKDGQQPAREDHARE